MNFQEVIAMIESVSTPEISSNPYRLKTWIKAVEWCQKNEPKHIIETGCYRGEICDGASTLILAWIAAYVNADTFQSYEMNPQNIEKARALLKENGNPFPVQFVEGDSIFNLKVRSYPIQFAYLDSMDHDPQTPWPWQEHQLAECKIVLAKLQYPAAILVDDNIEATGGKCKLTEEHLLELGWTEAERGYQILFTKEKP